MKVGFPQWRIMKNNNHGTLFVDKSPLLTAGLTVFVTGRSQQRGFLIVDYNQQQIHVPHQFTELKVVTYYHNMNYLLHFRLQLLDNKQVEQLVIYEHCVYECVHLFYLTYFVFKDVIIVESFINELSSKCRKAIVVLLMF